MAREFTNRDDVALALEGCTGWRYVAEELAAGGVEVHLAGHLTRQGPPLLRWALYEAAKSAARPTSPDHDYYREVKERLDGTRAALAVARKLARRVHHSLRAMGDEAWAPPQ